MSVTELSTQEDCNAAHVRPVEYGDQGDYILVGLQYSLVEARKLIREFLLETAGSLEGYELDHIGKYGLHLGKDEDGDPNYVLSFTSREPAPWLAWGVGQS